MERFLYGFVNDVNAQLEGMKDWTVVEWREHRWKDTLIVTALCRKSARPHYSGDTRTQDTVSDCKDTSMGTTPATLAPQGFRDIPDVFVDAIKKIQEPLEGFSAISSASTPTRLKDPKTKTYRLVALPPGVEGHAIRREILRRLGLLGLAERQGCTWKVREDLHNTLFRLCEEGNRRVSADTLIELDQTYTGTEFFEWLKGSPTCSKDSQTVVTKIQGRRYHLNYKSSRCADVPEFNTSELLAVLRIGILPHKLELPWVLKGSTRYYRHTDVARYEIPVGEKVAKRDVLISTYMSKFNNSDDKA